MEIASSSMTSYLPPTYILLNYSLHHFYVSASIWTPRNCLLRFWSHRKHTSPFPVALLNAFSCGRSQCRDGTALSVEKLFYTSLVVFAALYWLKTTNWPLLSKRESAMAGEFSLSWHFARSVSPVEDVLYPDWQGVVLRSGESPAITALTGQ